MFNATALHQYLRQHPHYLSHFLKDILRVWWWRLYRQHIVVLTTESGGLGDYLWFRSYYSAIREHYAPAKCRIIVIGMRQWEPLAIGMDSSFKSNHFDLYRSFESPDNPLRIESLFFKLFRTDVYVDFRARHLQDLVNAKKCYFGKGFREAKQYYETANNNVINQWFSLPNNFKHKPAILQIADKERYLALEKPYVVMVEGGNTQGKLSDEQTLSIIKEILYQGYDIFFNGDYKHLKNTLFEQNFGNETSRIIDGYTYPLAEYPYVVAQCQYVVTVNTFIYHLAIQLEKPCIVLSANEYESIKLDASNQIILFNSKMQQALENQSLDSYKPISNTGLQNIECKRIVEAINTLNHKL